MRLGAILPHAHDAIAARREYLMARRDADARKRLRPGFAVYCVELGPKPGTTCGARPPIYVGQTTRTPDERKVLLQWMRAGRRTYSDSEMLWTRYLQLPEPARANLTDALIDSL